MSLSRANLGALTTSLAIQACGLLTGVITARMLGPVARGELATVMLWPIIFGNLAILGCNWALAREVAADDSAEAEWLCAAMALSMLAAFLAMTIGYFSMPHLLPLDRRYLVPLARLCLLMIPLDIVSQVLLAVDQGRMRWHRYNFSRLSFFVIYAALVALLWLNGTGRISLFVGVFLAGQAVSVLYRLAMHARSLARGKVHLSLCLRLLCSGIPYGWATATNLLTLQLDRILVVSLMSSEAIGIYAVALTFGNAQSFVGEALGITSFAFLSHENDREQQKRILAKTFRQSALLSLGSAAILALVIPFTVTSLFGVRFAQAIHPAVILTVASAFIASSGTLNQGLRGIGKPFPGLVSQFFGTGILAVAAIALLPKFGLTGMAFAVVLSATCQMAALVGAAAFLLNIPPSHFWPFRMRELVVFPQSVSKGRLRHSRSLA